MLPPIRHLNSLQPLLERFPIVALLGPRQIGKTTLARAMASTATRPVHLFDQESPEVQARLLEPLLALRRLTGLVMLDEIQLVPDILPVLRVLVDRPDNPSR